MFEPCRIRMLGSLSVELGEVELHRFRTQKTGALLAYLAYHAGVAHPREILADLLWPTSGASAGRTALRVALNSLRRQFEPLGVPRGTILVADRFTVQLNRDNVATDVATFRDSLSEARRATTRAGEIAALESAVEAYGGPLLPGLYQDWILPERERLAGLAMQVFGRLVELHLEAGDAGRAVECARQAVAVDPLREEGHLELVRCLAEVGQYGAALRQYQAMVELLRAELDDEPSPEAEQLREQLRHGAPIGGRPPGPERPRSQRGTPRRRDDLPRGTVTFLVAEALLEGAERRAQASCLSLLSDICRERGGRAAAATESTCLHAFARASDALDAAVAGQRALAARGDTTAGIGARMAVDTGEVDLGHGAYRGSVLGRIHELVAAAHGGQILCSEQSAALVRDTTAAGRTVSDLGLYRLGRNQAPSRVFGVEYPGCPAESFPPLRAPLAYRGGLPKPPTRFFGREGERELIRDALADDDTRLVTLTGPAGSGKTRLAIEVARELRDAFNGAVGSVQLQDVSDRAGILRALGSAAGKPRSPGMDPIDHLLDAVADQPTLLVVDNAEHVLDDAAEIIRCLLERAPTLTCLVTSRRRLQLSGETEFRVPPLPVPTRNASAADLMMSPSVQLFVDRAQRARPDFQVTPGSSEAIGELCARLEGIPLALELAAARMGTMTPSQVVEGLHERLDLLVERRRDVPGRLQSLRAALDWSFRLLPDGLRTFLARLSVLRGAWTAEAAAAVCSEASAPEYIDTLWEWSLVEARREPARIGQTRYRMLETIREYAQEQLDARDRRRCGRAHAGYFVRRAACLGAKLAAGSEAEALSEMEAERANFRAALDWLEATRDIEQGLCLASSLFPLWSLRGHVQEGRDAIERLMRLAGSTLSENVLARALETVGKLALRQGDTAEAISRCQAAKELYERAGDAEGTIRSLTSLANAVMARGDLCRARELHRQAVELSGSGHAALRSVALNNLANAAYRQGELGEAEELYRSSLAIRRDLGLARSQAECLIGLGNVAMARGTDAEAHRLYEEALEVCRQFEHSTGIAGCLQNLGVLAERRGDVDEARLLHQESLAIWQELGDRRCAAQSLHGLAVAESRAEKLHRARALYGDALSLYEEVGDSHGAAKARLGLAGTALRIGRTDEAQALRDEALAGLLPGGDRQAILEGLEVSAAIYDQTGDSDRSQRLAALVADLRRRLAVGAAPGTAGAGDPADSADWAEAIELALGHLPPERP